MVMKGFQLFIANLAIVSLCFMFISGVTFSELTSLNYWVTPVFPHYIPNGPPMPLPRFFNLFVCVFMIIVFTLVLHMTMIKSPEEKKVN